MSSSVSTVVEVCYMHKTQYVSQFKIQSSDTLSPRMYTLQSNGVDFTFILFFCSFVFQVTPKDPVQQGMLRTLLNHSALFN